MVEVGCTAEAANEPTGALKVRLESNGESRRIRSTEALLRPLRT